MKSISKYIWFDGKFVSEDKAKVPVTTHAIHYGTSIFEGIRAYWNSENLFVFRLNEHIKRFRNSGKYYNILLRFSDAEIKNAVINLCKKNKIKKLLLLGYSWGTTTTAAYTSLNPKKIKRLALYAPFYAYDDPKRAAESEDPKKPGRWIAKIGAWRWVTESEQRNRWDGCIPIGKHKKWRTEKSTVICISGKQLQVTHNYREINFVLPSQV